MRAYDVWDTRKHIAYKRKKVYEVLTDETKAVLNEYELLPKQVNRLWSIFCKLDKKSIGYIQVEKILVRVSEREYSIVAPFAYRFFEIIDKQLLDRVSFQELLVGLIHFCTFNRQELLAFVFNMLDTDCN